MTESLNDFIARVAVLESDEAKAQALLEYYQQLPQTNENQQVITLLQQKIAAGEFALIAKAFGVANQKLDAFNEMQGLVEEISQVTGKNYTIIHFE